MTDLTTGQRIAQCRKMLNLSQEGLGEKVGVSRQAISKWEADAALPDIDNLIALSKLFGVNVGWLLCVEEEAQSQPESPPISEELLHKIEEFVKRYQPQKKKSLPLWKMLVLGTAVLALLWGGVLLRDQWQSMDARLSQLSSRLNDSRNSNATILNQLDDLQEQIDQLSKASADFYISGHSFQIEPDIESANALVTLSAVPGRLNGDYRVSLSVRRDGQQVVSQACAWDGSGFTAQVLLPLENGYEYWLTAEYPNGAQEQVGLLDSTAENLKSSFTIQCDIAHGLIHFDSRNNTLTLDDYEIHLARPNLTSGHDVDWESMELILYHTRGSDRQIVYTDSHFDPKLHEQEQQGAESEIREFWFYPNHPYPLPELADGDGLELWICAEMSNGISLMQMVDSWAYLDGEFLGGTPVE